MMAEDTTTSTTPLDLLINAIAGSTDFHYPPSSNTDQVTIGQDGPSAHVLQPESSGELNLDGFLAARKENVIQRAQREVRPPSPRQIKLAQTLTAHVVQSAINSPADSGLSSRPKSLSTVEVWHPTTAQKSYGKERRILNPPPILRVSGPISPSIASVTISSAAFPPQPDDVLPSGSQSHRFALTTIAVPTDVVSGRSKRGQRQTLKRKLHEAALVAGFGATLPRARRQIDGKDKDRLQNGLTFPALWVGEEAGKRKEFRLELKIGQPGVEEITGTIPPATQIPESSTRNAVSTAHNDFAPAEHESDLAQVLGTPTMEVLQPLAEAVRQANEGADPTLADYTKIAADAIKDHYQSQEAEISVIIPQQVPTEQPSDKIVATFHSSPLRIVSKPSQKTAKARSMASCFARDASFSLWTRIHAQTVRTKYMSLETGLEGVPRLTSKTGKWTPFQFDVIQRAALPPADTKSGRRQLDVNIDREDDKLTYGSIVALVDLQSGIKSDSVRLVKVENNEVRVGEDEGHPVSELQRIALVKVDDDGDEHNREGKMTGRWYLSAPGARLGGGESGHNLFSKRSRGKLAESPTSSQTHAPETLDGIDLNLAAEGQAGETDDQQRAKKKRKTKRNALAAAVLAEEDDVGLQTALRWVQADSIVVPGAAAHQHGDAARPLAIEKVADWMSWIIGGVSSFTYTFFNTLESRDESSTTPIDPVPCVLIPPTFHSMHNTLDLTLSQFHFPISVDSTQLEPLDVYLGPIGPLHTTLWRSTAPSDGSGNPTPAIPFDAIANSDSSSSGRVTSSYPAGREHVIVVVEMPNPEEIIKTMQDCVAQAALNTTIELSKGDGQATDTGRDITANDTELGDESHQQLSEVTLSAPWFDTQATAVQDDLLDEPEAEKTDDMVIAAALDLENTDFTTLQQLESFETGTGVESGLLPMASTTELENLDPTLSEVGGVGQSSTPSFLPSTTPQTEPATTATGIQLQDENVNLLPVNLVVPDKTERGNVIGLVPLPLLLIRKSDGYAFGTGRKVVAINLNANANGNAENGAAVDGIEGLSTATKWGLRVVEA